MKLVDWHYGRESCSSCVLICVSQGPVRAPAVDAEEQSPAPDVRPRSVRGRPATPEALSRGALP
eukprot:583899-Pyramimonas_sp.AAC.1